MDKKLFQVNGSLVGLYNASALAINTTGRYLLYRRDPFRACRGAVFALVTIRCVLNVWNHLPATPFRLSTDQQNELVHFVELLTCLDLSKH